jgi:hypothetical protein
METALYGKMLHNLRSLSTASPSRSKPYKFVTDKEEIRFISIRDDWYKANQLMPRLVRKALVGSSSALFRGFPRQWIPLFEYYGLKWADSCSPSEYMPLVSEMSEAQLLQHCVKSKHHGVLRTLVESIVTLDPVLADFLYVLENSVPLKHTAPKCSISESAKLPLRLTGWQSYGRPEVRQLEAEIDGIMMKGAIAVILPCSRHRPYGASRTHARIWRKLREEGYESADSHRVVFTSLAIVPEELWDHPVVMNYDAGVPDIYRLLRLARRFFGRNRYDVVVNCLEFQPYSDVLSILSKENVIRNLITGPVRRNRQFFLRS